MNGLDHPTLARLPEPLRPLRTTIGLITVGLLATGMAFALYRLPTTSLTLILVGGMLVLGVLALAVVRYDAAVALGFVVFGVVKVEPALPDLILICVIAVAFVTGRFDLDRVPMAVLGPIGAFHLAQPAHDD